MSEKFISLHLLSQSEKKNTFAFVHLKMLKLVNCRSEPKFLELTDDQSQRSAPLS